MLRIAFRYGDQRFFSRLVCWWRGGDSAHCEIAVPLNPYLNYMHLCVSSSFLDGGVRKKSISLIPAKWRVYEVPDSDIKEINLWFEKNRGVKYDWLGLLGFIIPRINGWTNRKFCCEAIAEVLRLNNPEKFDLLLLESVVQRIGRRVY